MSDLDASAVDWITRYAAAAGVEAPSEADVEELLSLAGVAAHASARQAAPITCWIAARAGLSPPDALALAKGLVE
jgi:hypothetical protein